MAGEATLLNFDAKLASGELCAISPTPCWDILKLQNSTWPNPEKTKLYQL